MIGDLLDGLEPFPVLSALLALGACDGRLALSCFGRSRRPCRGSKAMLVRGNPAYAKHRGIFCCSWHWLFQSTPRPADDVRRPARRQVGRRPPGLSRRQARRRTSSRRSIARAARSNSSLWLVPVTGGEPKRLTTTPGTNNHPRWSPDGKTVAFVSSRGGSAQVWLLPIDGGEPRQLTKLPIDVAGPLWSPKGDKVAFAAEVYPGKTPEETAAKDKEKEASKSKVRIYDSLMIRHWIDLGRGQTEPPVRRRRQDRRSQGSRRPSST